MNDEIKILANHEAGHLLINILLENLPPFVVQNLSIKPPKATKILVKPTTCTAKDGEVENSGFPYCCWKKETVDEMTDGCFSNCQSLDEINEKTENLFINGTLYRNSKDLTIAAIFTCMAGFVAEKVMNKDGVKHEYGEEGSSIDNAQGDKFINLLISDKFTSTQDDGYIEEMRCLKNHFLMQLEVFIKNENVMKSLKIISASVQEKSPNEEEKLVIEGAELEQLKNDVFRIVKPCLEIFKNLLSNS